jgi:DNA-binding PadR family transcriptional regulator
MSASLQIVIEWLYIDVMRDTSRPSSPLQLVVLALVFEEPMHPYRMHALIKQRGKDQVANVAQRNSVYQTIRVLERAGLIRARETSRDERRPERTTYEITDEGRRTLRTWMEEMIATPAREFPDFPAALSQVAGLPPDELRTLLERRIAALEKRLSEIPLTYPGLPRVFLLESEYQAAMIRGELDWLRTLVEDLRTRRLTWSEEELRQVAAQFASANPLPA